MLEFSAKEWERIDELVDAHGYSIAEAKEIVEADRAIDKGEKLFELDKELEAGAKKARRADRKTGVTQNRKPDDDKIVLMTHLMRTVDEYKPTQTKPGEFVFTYNDRKFKVVLSAPRS